MNLQPKPTKEPKLDYAIHNCDSLLYQCLLKRDKKCIRCGSYDKLVPSHCYGKKAYPALRHILLNNLLLCDDCHKWWHANIHDSWIWFVNKFHERYEYLVIKKNEYVKLNKAHYQETAKQLLIEIEKRAG